MSLTINTWDWDLHPVTEHVTELTDGPIQVGIYRLGHVRPCSCPCPVHKKEVCYGSYVVRCRVLPKRAGARCPADSAYSLSLKREHGPVQLDLALVETEARAVLLSEPNAKRTAKRIAADLFAQVRAHVIELIRADIAEGREPRFYEPSSFDGTDYIEKWVNEP